MWRPQGASLNVRLLTEGELSSWRPQAAREHRRALTRARHKNKRRLSIMGAIPPEPERK